MKSTHSVTGYQLDSVQPSVNITIQNKTKAYIANVENDV